MICLNKGSVILSMPNKAVSIIMPVYKVEGTVEAAVKSIQAQTYKNLEIILVDDGTPDKSGEICDRLAQDDVRIKVIHKKNGGVSSARNEGIRQATSDFVCFVDSDDEIESTMIEKFMKNQFFNDVQLVVSGVTEYYKNLIKYVCESSDVLDFANLRCEKILELCSKKIMMFSTAKLFDRNIIIENSLFFNEELVCGEDHLFVFQYLFYANKVSFINEPLYRYYCYNSSAPTRFFPLSGQIDIYKAKEKFIRRRCSKKIADEYCAKIALRNLVARFNYLVKRSIKDHKELSEAYDFYWPYIELFSESPEVFLEEDYTWLEKNRNQLKDKNIKLATYASRCIENEILMYLRRTGKQKSEVSLDEPLSQDDEGNELLLSDILSNDVLSKEMRLVSTKCEWDVISSNCIAYPLVNTFSLKACVLPFPL